MTQDERWMEKYKEVMEFIESEHRNPSKFVDSERGLRNWLKACRKMINAGKMKPARVVLFDKLQELIEKYRRVNQYQ